MALPEGVQIVRKNGKPYYYWAPGRGTKNAGERVPLGSDPASPAFWEALRGFVGTPAPPTGTWDALIRDYRGDEPDYIGCPEWNRMKPASKANYNFYLDRISTSAGDRLVKDVTKQDVYRLRDDKAGTPVSANHHLSILRTLIEFGISRGYRQDNPVIGVKRLKIDAGGARPWPEQGYAFVLEHGPTDLRRMAILGRATGQRVSDLVRIRPADRYTDGFNLRISKLRGKEHFQPLTQAELAEIDSWSVGKLDLYIKNRKSQPYTARNLNSRWNFWRGTAVAKPIVDLKMTIHGLRATAVCDRRLHGMEHQEIAAELCMSIQMVMHYSRFIDQPALARRARDRREREQNFL